MRLIVKPDCTVQASKIPIETIIKDSYLENPSNTSLRWNLNFINYTATVPIDSEYFTSGSGF